MNSRTTKIVLLGALFIIPIALLIILVLFKKNPQNIQTPNSGVGSPTVTPVQFSSSFSVLSTTPKNGATNVSPGEITVSFSSDTTINSSGLFTLSFNPKLSAGYQFVSTFPAKQVSFVILNGLIPSTKYDVSIKKPDGTPIYTWSFTTNAGTGGLSSSGYENQLENDYINKNYPLSSVTPYSNADFSIDYAGKPLTLAVQIKNPDINKVKQEVIDWIKSKGVDPSTHTINYTNSF